MTRTTQAPTFWTYRVLFVALFASTFIYLFILRTLGELAPPPADVTMVIAFAFVSLGVATMSFLVPRFLLDAAYRTMKPAIVEEADPNAEGLFRDQAPTRPVFADPDAMRAAVIRVSFTPFILGLAMSEAVALFGFVLRLLGHGWGIVLPFFVLAWALMLPRFPREAAMCAQAERRLGARFA